MAGPHNNGCLRSKCSGRRRDVQNLAEAANKGALAYDVECGKGAQVAENKIQMNLKAELEKRNEKDGFEKSVLRLLGEINESLRKLANPIFMYQVDNPQEWKTWTEGGSVGTIDYPEAT